MEFMSESSTDGKSFGLLDENLLQGKRKKTTKNIRKIDNLLIFLTRYNTKYKFK